MWQYLGLIALDIANERADEARQRAERWRQLANDESQPAPRPGIGRRAAAGVLRRFSDASHALSEAACEAASRLEHRTA
jgi:hypothetical protein